MTQPQAGSLAGSVSAQHGRKQVCALSGPDQTSRSVFLVPGVPQDCRGFPSVASVIWLERSGLVDLLCVGLPCFCWLSSSTDCIPPFACISALSPALLISGGSHLLQPYTMSTLRWFLLCSGGLALSSAVSSSCNMLCSEQASCSTQEFCDFTKVISPTPDCLTVSGDTSWKCMEIDLIHICP